MAPSNGDHRLLPPPVAAILFYAAEGLSVWNRRFSPAGRPRTPERAGWCQMFRLLIESPEGLRTLRNLAMSGMLGWDCPKVYIECLDAAFRDISFKARAIAALEDLADTARERFVLPEPPRQAPAGDIRPLVPRTTPASEPPTPPRPGPRPHGRGYKPG